MRGAHVLIFLAIVVAAWAIFTQANGACTCGK